MPFNFDTFKQQFDTASNNIDEQLQLVDKAIQEIDESIYINLEEFHNDIWDVISLVTDLRPFILPFASIGRVWQQAWVWIENNQITPESFDLWSLSSKSNLDRAKLLEQSKDLLIAHWFEVESLVWELISLAKTGLFIDSWKNRTDYFNGEWFQQLGYAWWYAEVQKVYRDYLLDCIDKLSNSNTDIKVYPNPSSWKVTVWCPKYRYDYSSIHKSLWLTWVAIVNPDWTVTTKVDYDYTNATYNPLSGLPIIVNTWPTWNEKKEELTISATSTNGQQTNISASEQIYEDGWIWVTDYVQVWLDLSHLADWVYFINIDGMWFTKIVIQH